jgi:hypothetical protein
MNTIIKKIARGFHLWKPACFIWMALLAMTTSCKEDEIGQKPTDRVPPKGLAGAEAIPRPGGALITYTIPTDDSDISYIMGEFEAEGETKIIRSSVYKDFLLIEGLGSNVSTSVNLYVVDHSENKSDPKTVTFTTLEAPFATIANSIQINPGIGGIYLMWQNPEKRSDIGVVLMMYDTAYQRMSEYAVSFASAGVVFYPFPTVDDEGNKLPPYDFAAYVLDKWGHYSDTLRFTVSPVLEMRLNRLEMSGYPIGNDTRHYENSGVAPDNPPYDSRAHRLFDSIARALGSTNSQLSPSGFGILGPEVPHAGGAANSSGKLPVYYTIDMGVEAVLSRYWMPGRDHGNNRNGGAQLGRFAYGFRADQKWPCWPYHWKLWGTATDFGEDSPDYIPDDDPYWTEDAWKEDARWAYMGEYFCRRPFYPNAMPQDPGPDDFAGGNENRSWGQELNLVYVSPFESPNVFMYPIQEPGVPPVRYIRFELIESWAESHTPSATVFFMHELWFWGGIPDE